MVKKAEEKSELKMVNKFFKLHWDLIIGYSTLILGGIFSGYSMKTCNGFICEVVGLILFFDIIIPIFIIFLAIATTRNLKNKQLRKNIIRHVLGTTVFIIVLLFWLFTFGKDLFFSQLGSSPKL